MTAPSKADPSKPEPNKPEPQQAADAESPESAPLGDDDAIQFGDVLTANSAQQAHPQKTDTQKTDTEQTATLPPELDGHMLHVPVGSNPADSSALPGDANTSEFAPTAVHVALDAMLDMQTHAAEDTSVELGGVLVGRRGCHADGTPYVLIRDSLRARHYRATRGSFTFTHETWADLHAQLELLPKDSQIVGWYHTHPGWGVFLSEMDIFICDHFFSHPDDVALVIDPTSGDTGLFVRREAHQARSPRRLSRYHLFAHRRRDDELKRWARYFSGALLMPTSASVFPGRDAAPILVTPPAAAPHPAERWLPMVLGIILVGQLTITALLLAMLWQAANPTVEDPRRAAELLTREAVVDGLLAQSFAGNPDATAQSYRQLVTDHARLRADHQALGERATRLTQQLRGTQTELQNTRLAEKRASAELKKSEANLARLTLDGGVWATLRRFGVDAFSWVLGTTCGLLAAAGIGAGYWWFLRYSRQSEAA